MKRTIVILSVTLLTLTACNENKTATKTDNLNVENQQKPNTMKKLQYTINIEASADKVYNTMLGLDDKATYEAWTAEFNPTSTFEGNWEKGSKMYFIGTGEDGQKGGMVSEVAENIPNKFVSIRHYGILKGDTEITTGEEIEKWAGGLENYTFEENNGITTVIVEVDITEDYVDYFNETYPKALSKLKSMLEN